jgi:hypothetical protein
MGRFLSNGVGKRRGTTKKFEKIWESVGNEEHFFWENQKTA